MSPLKCHTVQEAIWERAASAGPAPLSPALADHLATCPLCQAESRAVSDLVAVARALPDPAPPAGLWDGFEEALERRLSRGAIDLAGAWRRWGRRAASLAAAVALGIAIGFAAAQMAGPSPAERAAAQREALVAALAHDARLEAYLAAVEERLAAERGREPLTDAFVAGPGAPTAEAGERLAQAAAERERLRFLLLAMLAAEVESEAHGFAYLDRRIASLAGQHLLYFVP